MRLKGKTVFITGASRGIGKTAALMMAKEGAEMIVCATGSASAEAVADEIRANGGKALGLACNVSDRASVDAALASAVDTFGKIDVVINNAGITADATMMKMTEEQWDSVINTNLKGAFNVGQAGAKLMTEKGGVIINTASVVGLYGNFGQSNYAATKWGIIGMTKTWAKELGKYNIRVNAVAPGFIMTEMTAKMPEKALESMKEKSPLKKLGSPEDVGYAYIYLASDESSFTTGSVLSLDGGVVL